MEEQHDNRPTTLPPKIPGGCVLLSRKALDSDLMDQSPLVVKLWVWILLKANWRDREQLKRGQLVTTIAEMQEAMSHYSGWRKIVPTKDELRSAYGALSKATRIATRKTTRGMVITVINYGTYQDISAYASHTEDLKGIATEPPATPRDTEEVKEVKNTSCPKPKKPVSPDALRLSGMLADMILKNNPRHTKLSNGSRVKTVASWAKDIDKLLHIDKQTPEAVESIISQCQRDEFWRANILSGAKLREKWDTLVVKFSTVSQSSPPPSQERPLQVAL